MVKLPYIDRLLEHGEDRCPKCGSHQVEGRFVETGGGEAHQGMDCLDCGLHWMDNYCINDIHLIHE